MGKLGQNWSTLENDKKKAQLWTKRIEKGTQKKQNGQFLGALTIFNFFDNISMTFFGIFKSKNY